MDVPERPPWLKGFWAENEMSIHFHGCSLLFPDSQRANMDSNNAFGFEFFLHHRHAREMR